MCAALPAAVLCDNDALDGPGALSKMEYGFADAPSGPELPPEGD
jgi:hypothetical protein